MPEAVNPYIAGNPVTGAEMFFGREDVFAFVRQALIGRHRDNVIILYGQRRTGKTSALYQLSRHLGSRYVCCFIDLHGLALDGLDGFLWELANSIARTLRRDQQLQVPLPARAAFGPNPRDVFENEFLTQVWSALGDRHLLLMLDEAIRLQEQVQAGKLPRETFEYLRHLMQHHERLNFLFALGDGLEGMTREYAFLFSVGLYKKISFLERSAALALIQQPVREYYTVDPAASERILQITAGHPYYTQLLCHSLFNRWQHTHTSLVQVQDVEQVVGETVERGLAVLKHVWEEAAPAEKAVLAGAAAAMGDRNRPVHPDEVAQALRQSGIVLPALEQNQAYKALLARDVLAGRDRYCFAVDLQRLWIQQYERLEWVRDEIAGAVPDWTEPLSTLPAAEQAVAPQRLPAPPAPPGDAARPPVTFPRVLLASAGGIALLLVAVLLLSRLHLLSPGSPAPGPTTVPVLPTASSPPATATVLPTLAPPPTSGPIPIQTTVPIVIPPTAPPPTAPPTPVFGAGVKIVFTSGAPGCSTLGMLNLDTDQFTTFKVAPNNEEPSWAPDGKRFVASTGDCQNTTYRLTIFDAAAGSATSVPTDCDKSIDPHWAHDGRIYFACGARTDNGQLYSMNPDGTDRRDLGLAARRPTLSPDGKLLAYMRQDNGVWRIWVGAFDAEGRLTDTRQLPFPQVLGGVYARQPRWNSDGTRIYFNITDQSSLRAIALGSVDLATSRTNVSFITADADTPFVRPVCGHANVCVAGGASGGLWLLQDVNGTLVPRRQLTFGEEFGADVYP